MYGPTSRHLIGAGQDPDRVRSNYLYEIVRVHIQKPACSILNLQSNDQGGVKA